MHTKLINLKPKHLVLVIYINLASSYNASIKQEQIVIIYVLYVVTVRKIINYPGSNKNTSALATSKYLDTFASVTCNKEVSLFIYCQSKGVLSIRQG